MQETAAGCPQVKSYLIKVLEKFYDVDILSEENILLWYSKCENSHIKNRVREILNFRKYLN